MIYSKNTVIAAICKVIPETAIMKDNGVHINVPDWLKKVGEVYFLTQYGDLRDCRDLGLEEALYICHKALSELNDVGYISYGEADAKFIEMSQEV